MGVNAVRIEVSDSYGHKKLEDTSRKMQQTARVLASLCEKTQDTLGKSELFLLLNVLIFANPDGYFEISIRNSAQVLLSLFVWEENTAPDLARKYIKTELDVEALRTRLQDAISRS